MLSGFSYITIPGFSGDIKSDVKKLLYANKKSKTYRHVKAVAITDIKIAEQYKLDINICELCGYLHDISAVIDRNDMLAYAVENNWHIDEAEKKFPMLLHQRISRVIAEQDFNITDKRILSAIECHSTLKSNPSDYDMALFIADKLSWDQNGKPPFYDILRDALNQSLEAASLVYMGYIVENKMILHPHQWFNESMEFLRNLKNNFVGYDGPGVPRKYIKFTQD
ncbi:MAG: HD domain-containing protein [Oscillospiraceae bacterium]|nr:HD domain-containing protein [Oscillospiraceae bacterium]